MHVAEGRIAITVLSDAVTVTVTVVRRGSDVPQIPPAIPIAPSTLLRSLFRFPAVFLYFFWSVSSELPMSTVLIVSTKGLPYIKGSHPSLVYCKTVHASVDR